MADIPLIVDGDDSFVFGVDGYTAPWKLAPGEYSAGLNLINRGGIAQTRPGSKAIMGLPDGNLQGMTTFTPTGGVVNIVACVDGIVYFSPYPFLSYRPLRGVQFSPDSKFIAWASCIQSTYYTEDGTLQYLDTPLAVLVMQDGATRAAFWNGSEGRHLNPTLSHSEFTIQGYDETPVGLWMIWSNNRLWVSRGNQIFASDIGNPLKFTETQYLNEGRAFYLTGECTGMVEVSNGASSASSSGYPGFIAFTKENGTFFQSSIQDRTQWLATAGFQQLALPAVGCVSPRSIVHQYGLVWWFTSKGLINQNAALTANISSRLDVQDNEMIQSKLNMGYDLGGVCGGFYENFLFHAVPNGSKFNTRVHVLDQAVFENSANSWPSYWMGWRPVEFSRAIINSQERCFCASVDYDGKNRVWEMFLSDKTDNGIPITSFVLTKQYRWNSQEYKKFRYAELELFALKGPVATLAAVAGSRGSFQTIMEKEITSTIGQVYSGVSYGDNGNRFGGSSAQTRVVRTQDVTSPSDCNEACVESDDRGLIDKQFCLLLVWSGNGGVGPYRVFCQNDIRSYEGICEDSEFGEIRLLNSYGCGSDQIFNYSKPFTTYYSTATFSGLTQSGTPITRSSTQSSLISQEDADRKAQATAKWYVLTETAVIPYATLDSCADDTLDDSFGEGILDEFNDPILAGTTC